MSYLVTGGLGFLGVNIAKYFREKGADVLVIDNRYKHIGTQRNLEMLTSLGVAYEYVDIRNANDVEILFQKNEFEAVFHMAAQVAFKKSITNPRLDFEINALGTFNLLEGVRKYQNETIFLLASTNQVYGDLISEEIIETDTRYDFRDLPLGIPETYPLSFLSPYGCSKGAADQYTLDYSKMYGLRSVVTRFGGIYGINQYSYEDHGWVSFMTDMIVHDVEFNRFGNGKQLRDILYIEDILKALSIVIDNIEIASGKSFNIAGGAKNKMSVLELIDAVERMTGNKAKCIVNEARKGDKKVSYLDITKANKELFWEPKVGTEEGLQKMIKWLSAKR